MQTSLPPFFVGVANSNRPKGRGIDPTANKTCVAVMKM
jgi:hypothetical protein